MCCFRLSVPPEGTLVNSLLTQGTERTIYKNLFENNLDTETPFVNMTFGLEKLVEGRDRAFLVNGGPIQMFKKYHCKVPYFNGSR
jgi:hypothetical protein